jgi:hypothetical protein
MNLTVFRKFFILCFSLCMFSVSAQDQKISPVKEIPAGASLVSIPHIKPSRTEKSTVAFAMKGIKNDAQLEQLMKNFDGIKDMENVSLNFSAANEAICSFSAYRIHLGQTLQAFSNAGFEYFTYDGNTYSISEYLQNVPVRSPENKVQEKQAN